MLTKEQMIEIISLAYDINATEEGKYRVHYKQLLSEFVVNIYNLCFTDGGYAEEAYIFYKFGTERENNNQHVEFKKCIAHLRRILANIRDEKMYDDWVDTTAYNLSLMMNGDKNE